MRWAFTSAGLVVVGAVVTVLVAWASAIWCDAPLAWRATSGYSAPQIPGARAAAFVPEAWKERQSGDDGRFEVSYYVTRSGTTAGTEATEFGVMGFPLDDGLGEPFGLGNVMYRVCGWPAHCLECARAVDPQGTWHELRSGLEPPAILDRKPHASPGLWVISSYPTALPVRPLAWPFVADSIFYALVLAALLAGPASVRRRWRRGHGRCPSCGYNRRGLAADAKCPECGTVPAPAAK
jgi:hypothetical protein